MWIYTSLSHRRVMKANHSRQIFSKAHSQPEAFKHEEEIAANLAFHKCLNVLKQEKNLKNRLSKRKA